MKADSCRQPLGIRMLRPALFLASVIAANWAVVTFGLVPVGFGLLAPAGVYVAGLAFTLRDLTQEAFGRRGVAGAILLGAVLSWFVAPGFALASGAAFLFSELADFAVYSPLRRRRRPLPVAVLTSNTVGAVLDSIIFLWLAFGSLDLLVGQIVGKSWVTLLAVVLLVALRGGRDHLPDRTA